MVVALRFRPGSAFLTVDGGDPATDSDNNGIYCMRAPDVKSSMVKH